MNGSGRYPARTAVLHWLMVIGILFLMAVGWYMVDIPRGTPPRGYWYNLHKSVGLIVFAVAVLFLYWRATLSVPPLPDSIPGWERRSALIAHRLMYVLLVVVPLSGYIEANFTKWGVDFFGYKLEPWGPENQRLYWIFNRIHVYSSNIFAGLIGLHVAAAIRHMLKRDGILERILPMGWKGKR
jgi:cytochrome b561